MAAIALVASFLGGKAVQGTVTLLFINVVAVIGLQIYSGNAGIVSFGHVSFMNIGAHVAALLTLPVALKMSQLQQLPAFLANVHLTFFPALGVAIVIALIFALLSGIPMARLAGSSAIIATLALLGAVYGLAIGMKGSQALYGVPRSTTLFTAFSLAVLAILVGRLFRDSTAGLELRAAREDESAAASIGVSIYRRRFMAWVTSGTVSAAAGVLLGHYLTVFSPKEFYLFQTFLLVAMLIVGGIATVSGAVVGTIVVTALIEVLRKLEEGPQIGPFDLPQIFGLTTLGLSFCMLVTMTKRREGLVGYFELDEQLGNLLHGGRRIENTPSSPASDPHHRTSNHILEVTSVTKTYGGVVANNQVSLKMSTGEIVGLIGPNGSGKTTLLNIISRAVEPASGRIFLDHHDITRYSADRAAQNGIARTYQSIRLFKNLTVFENVHTAVLASRSLKRSRKSCERTYDLLAELDLVDLAVHRAGTLAYGSQRRLEIARALAINPNFLLLDEPAAGMNEVESDALFDLLAAFRSRFGVGLLIVEHDLNLIMRLCDRIIVLNKGEMIASGSAEEVQSNPAVIEAYMGRRRRTAILEEGVR